MGIIKAFGGQIIDTAITGALIGQAGATKALGGFKGATTSLLGVGLLGRTADRFKLK